MFRLDIINIAPLSVSSELLGVGRGNKLLSVCKSAESRVSRI